MVAASKVLNEKVRLGLSGVTDYETRTTGGVLASKKILFTTTPTADHTITVNGRVFVFKASADADEDEITLGTGNGTELSETIDNAITKITAVATGLLTGFVLTKSDTNKSLVFTSKVPSTIYNALTLASSSTNGVVSTVATGTDGMISLNQEITWFADTQTSVQTFGIPDGVEGQRKTFILGARSNAYNIVIRPLHGTSTTITLDTANDVHECIFLGGSWRNLYSTATLA